MPTAEEVAKGYVKPNGKSKPKRAAWQGFVDIDLGPDHKDAIRDLSTDPLDVMGLVAELVEEGYKVSLSNDSAHNSYICAITQTDPGQPNAGYTLSGRGSTLEKAINSVAYKHFTLADGGWWKNVPAAAAWDDVG